MAITSRDLRMFKVLLVMLLQAKHTQVSLRPRLTSVSHTGDEISRELISALGLSVGNAVGYSIDWHL